VWGLGNPMRMRVHACNRSATSFAASISPRSSLLSSVFDFNANTSTVIRRDTTCQVCGGVEFQPLSNPQEVNCLSM
jgi:hypothetical protein